MKKNKKLWTLFLSMLQISAFTFGGGFVIVTFMKRRFVDELHWIEEEEMLDMTALAQSFPGAIAVNAAILMGWRMGGIAGMAVAVLATVIPPVVILGIISIFYATYAANRYVALVLRGMQAGVAAVIFDVVIGLGANVIRQKRILCLLVMAASFVAVMVFEVNVIFIILAAALTGILMELCGRKRREDR